MSRPTTLPPAKPYSRRQIRREQQLLTAAAVLAWLAIIAIAVLAVVCIALTQSPALQFHQLIKP